tara:strand:- start:4814 stop:5356 length:543 start_codon:yes stop_codon:yes gene_type:complete
MLLLKELQQRQAVVNKLIDDILDKEKNIIKYIKKPDLVETNVALQKQLITQYRQKVTEFLIKLVETIKKYQPIFESTLKQTRKELVDIEKMFDYFIVHFKRFLLLCDKYKRFSTLNLKRKLNGLIKVLDEVKLKVYRQTSAAGMIDLLDKKTRSLLKDYDATLALYQNETWENVTQKLSS